MGISRGYTETHNYTPIGNFISKAGVTQYYSSTKPHAVTGLSNGATFTYDLNGNMTVRVEGGVTYTQTWDVDNRLIDVLSGTQHTQFFYDADGMLVRKVDARGTTAYVGGDDEITWLVPTQTVTTTIPVTLTYKLYLPMMAMNTLDVVNGVSTTYYSFNGARVAMRTGSIVYWLHGDHLGSASLTTGITGAVVSEMRYTPFGEVRWQNGAAVSDHQFTSARFDATSNIVQMGARWYSPLLGRFLSPDSIVPRPGDSQAYNRYSYARNSPLTRIDPSGHADCASGDNACSVNEWMWKNRWYEAHGHFWDGNGWNKQGDARFANSTLLAQTLGEAGIWYRNGLSGATWKPEELELVAQGVVALANKIAQSAQFGISDGFRRLAELLGGSVAFVRDHANVLSSSAVSCVCDFKNTVQFFDILFADTPDFVRGNSVHELAHVMDFRIQFSVFGLSTNYTPDFPHGPIISNRAMEAEFNGIEYWAETLTDWVYGSRYRGPYVTGVRESLSIGKGSQTEWIERVLLGWGW